MNNDVCSRSASRRIWMMQWKCGEARRWWQRRTSPKWRNNARKGRERGARGGRKWRRHRLAAASVLAVVPGRSSPFPFGLSLSLTHLTQKGVGAKVLRSSREIQISFTCAFELSVYVFVIKVDSFVYSCWHFETFWSIFDVRGIHCMSTWLLYIGRCDRSGENGKLYI
jgi:hypothetical protein